MAKRPRQNTRAIRERNKRILAACDICHICGHAGADGVDHVLAYVRCLDLGLDPDDPTNLKPAHHDACPTCGRKCNREKGDRDYAPIIRRSGSLRPVD